MVRVNHLLPKSNGDIHRKMAEEPFDFSQDLPSATRNPYDEVIEFATS